MPNVAPYIVPKRVGRLIVGACAGKTKTGKRKYHTTCACGAESIKYGDNLKMGYARRCGKQCPLGPEPRADMLPKVISGWLYG